jgi:hypothetical protein
MKFFSNPMNWLMAFIILVSIISMFIMVRKLDHRTEQCDGKKGMMIGTVEGWRCLDVKEMK